MKLPYVIDNQTHILVDILKGLLSERKGRSLDVATAYFTVGGFGLLKEGLTDLGNFSLLLGAEPRSGEQVGLRPDSGVVKGLIRKDLEELPFDENTLRLVEDLDMPGKRGRESFVDRVLVESNKKLGETLEGKTKAKLDEIWGSEDISEQQPGTKADGQ